MSERKYLDGEYPEEIEDLFMQVLEEYCKDPTVHVTFDMVLNSSMPEAMREDGLPHVDTMQFQAVLHLALSHSSFSGNPSEHIEETYLTPLDLTERDFYFWLVSRLPEFIKAKFQLLQIQQREH